MRLTSSRAKSGRSSYLECPYCKHIQPQVSSDAIAHATSTASINWQCLFKFGCMANMT